MTTYDIILLFLCLNCLYLTLRVASLERKIEELRKK